MTDLSGMSDADLMASLERQKLPRGLRNNNPGNIEDGPFARSIPGYQGSDGRFAVYDSLDSGKAAHAALLGSYGRKGINTVEGVVNRWAPPKENDSRSYAQFVAQRLGVDPRAPLDMNDPKVVSGMASAMAERENGRPMPADLSGMSDADLMAALGTPAAPRPTPGQPGAPPMPQRPAAAPTKPQTSQRLGFEQGFQKPFENIGNWAVGAADRLGYEPADWVKTLSGNLKAAQQGVEATRPEIYQAKPGKAGQFAGNVLGTSWIPGGPMVQGAAGGALLSDEKTAGGVLKDTVIGGAFGKGADVGLQLLGKGATRLLSGKAKPDAIMALARDKVRQDAAAAGEKLGAADIDVRAAKLAKSALYNAVDNSGFRFQSSDVQKLVGDFQAEMGKTALSKEAKGNAQSIISYAKSLKNPSLSEMEKLRGDIYEALNKKGGDNTVIGSAFRSRIDGLIDGVDNGLVRQARAYNARFKKADYVYRASESADLAAEKTYGGDYGRKLKDRIAPLVDPLKTQRNFRGATADETAALNKVARGTKTQKVATELGAMTDPRRMGGKILSGALGGMTGTAGVMTGGASLPLTLALQAGQIGTGLAATGTASRIARKNLTDLINLISEGGSRRALAPVPTRASQAADRAIRQVVRPAAIVAAAPALAAGRRNSQTKAKK